MRLNPPVDGLKITKKLLDPQKVPPQFREFPETPLTILMKII